MSYNHDIFVVGLETAIIFKKRNCLQIDRLSGFENLLNLNNLPKKHNF